MSSKRGSRGNSRRSQRADQSSSEYSFSPDSDARDSPARTAAHRGEARPRARDASPPPEGGYDTVDDDGYEEKERTGGIRRERYDEEQDYPTSEDDSDKEEPEPERNDRYGGEEIEERRPGKRSGRDGRDRLDENARGKGKRGKKGLTHAEMVSSVKREEASASETEDESEDEAQAYAAAIRRSNSKAASERRRPPWSKCHPVVLEAMRMLESKGAEPSQLAYARLAGVGKVSMDYMVRKQAIVIGRSGYSDCTVKSEGRLVSRKHARLYWHSRRKEWVVCCLSKRNSILVNGIPVVLGSDPMPVKSRDLIEMGDVAFFFLAATAPVFTVSDIYALEKEIASVQEQERRFGEYEDEGSYSASHYVDEGRSRYPSKNYDDRYGSLDQSRYAGKSERRQHTSRRSSKPGSSKRPSSSMGGDDFGYDRPRKKSKSKKSKSGHSRAPLGSYGDADPEGTADEEDRKDADMSREEKMIDPPPSKMRSINENPPPSNERKRKEDEGRDNGDEESDVDQGAKYRDDWNKKERTDFVRALFAVGVDPVLGDDGSVEYYDFKRFRRVAQLSKKSDGMLEDYYLKVMSDVNSLLDEEEREKRTKGPRTKHKAGCDCIVCENTRKSRRKKREELDCGVGDDGGAEDSDVGEDADVKSTAKASDKLVGLVTAQKLRVRIGIHDAAREMSSEAGESVLEKYDLARDHPVKDFPSWWRSGYHDRALMKATAKHGVGQWSDIWMDNKQKPFRKERERQGANMEWPTNQAAMKRVREIASAINAELRREAKRTARDSRYTSRGPSSKKSLSSVGRPTSYGKGKTAKHKKLAGRKARLVNDRGHDGTEQGAGRNREGDSSSESGSGNEERTKGDAAEVETEDEDEMEVEVEVEEEMEIEEEEADGEETEDDNDNVAAAPSGGSKKTAGPAGEICTDDDDDIEDVIQYETASDTGTE